MSTAELYLHLRTRPGEALVNSVRDHAWLMPWLRVAFGSGAVVADAAVVAAAFLVTFWLGFVRPDADGQTSDYLVASLGVGIGTCCLLALQGAYDQERPAGWARRLHSTVSAVSTALLIVLTIAWFSGNHADSRLWLATGWPMAIAGLAIWRTVADRLYLSLPAGIAPVRRVLIVGATEVGQQLARELADGHHVVGYVDHSRDVSAPAGVPVLGPLSALERLVDAYAVDELVIALPAHRREAISAVLARGFERPVKVKLLPDAAEILPRCVAVEQFAGRAFLGFVASARVTWVKRALDLVVTSLSLLALGPVMLAIACLIKLDSPGPVFYRQERVGKNGRRFQMIKFRSMRPDADRLLASLQSQNEASGPLFKIRNDPRVTRVGHVLRRLSLDELPQVFNVLNGDMSLVGPRPPLASEVAKYEDWQLGRLRAVPGMTGLWQVSGRSELPFHDMVRLDLDYIRNWSFGLDLQILLRTIPAVLASRGAY